MADGRITFSGNLMGISTPFKTKGDYPKTGVFFRVARNYRYFDREKNDWVEIGTKVQNCVVYGKTADNFIESEIPLGTPLTISGILRGQVSPAYVSKSGVEVEESFEENVNVEELGVSLQWFPISIPGKGERTGGSNKPRKNSQATSKAAPKESVKAAPKKAEKKDDDIFGNLDDIFGPDTGEDSLDNLWDE